MGFTQFQLRGLEKVEGEWTAVTLAYNIKRLWTLNQGPRPKTSDAANRNPAHRTLFRPIGGFIEQLGATPSPPSVSIRGEGEHQTDTKSDKLLADHAVGEGRRHVLPHDRRRGY